MMGVDQVTQYVVVPRDHELRDDALSQFVPFQGIVRRVKELSLKCQDA
jgi:hypothetical protein